MKNPIWYSNKGNPIPVDPDRTITGYLPLFLDEDDPRGAWEQFSANYQSGMMEITGLRTVKPNFILYPGDPPFRAIAETKLRDERIVLYEAEIVCVFQPDGTHKCSRMS